MAGVQIAGLASGFNWQSIINAIGTANSANVNQVTSQKATIDSQATALSTLKTDMVDFSTSVLNLQDNTGGVFSGVSVTSSDPASTWTGTASNGTPVGNYTVSVSQLATSSILNGGALTVANLNTGSALSALNTSSPITTGTFTIDGAQFTITSTAVTLQDVLTSINSSSSATGVTAAFDATNDVVRLTNTSTSSSASPIVLGAANDSSNILSVLKLSNASPVIASSSPGNYTTSSSASYFSLNGSRVLISEGESLSSIIASISSYTNGSVTGALSTTGSVTLTANAGGSIALDNGTSTFLSDMHLLGTGVYSVASSSKNGAIVPSNTLTSSGITSSGISVFSVNGVQISYDTSVDTLTTILRKINNSTAGVTASYDTNNNRIVLANNNTGNTGISVSDVSGSLMATLKLTSAQGSTLNVGSNALFRVNGGSLLSSSSNTLDGSTFGATGLSLNVNSLGTQTIQASTNATSIQTAINALITSYNKLETDISTDTQVTVSSNGVAVNALLSSNYEVYNWGRDLQNTVFNAGSQLTGSIKSLAQMGIGFTGTSRLLSITDQSKLTQALTQKASDVAAFFQTGTTGFGSTVHGKTINTMANASKEFESLTAQSTNLSKRITFLQAQLASQQASLQAQFQAMESAYSKYQTQLSAINNLSGYSSSGSSSSINSSNVSYNGQSLGSSSSSSSSGSSSSSTKTA
jgi:flagellar hook-associated protein 2